MRAIFLALTAFPILLSGQDRADQQKEGERLFSLKVRSILESKCLACHGEEGKKVKGKFNLATLEGLLAGGETADDVLVPFHPEKSLLLTAIEWKDEDYEMPPKENDRLNEKQIAQVRRWIKLGAPWPNEELQKKYILSERSKERTEDGVILKTSGGLSEDWTYRRYKDEDVWAFQPVEKPEVPQGAHPVDVFVGNKLKKAGFRGAPIAHFRTLVKRAYYDLTGLPPTPFEIYQFRLAWDKDPEKAWTDLVDKLLDSPHYGERWGQHWLDVARYADTGGYSNDFERSNAWRYRDYVIRAFNEDKPYDEFVVEQIAGDELWEKQPKGEKNAELLVASSFLRMGPWDPAMVKAPEARQIFLDDVVNSVGQTFLSTTMRCLKCHDHKFDPLPTRDYYRMYAAFAGTQLAERPAPFLPKENRVDFKQSKAMAEQLLAFAKKKRKHIEDKREQAARQWYAENNLPYKNSKDRRGDPDEKKPPRHAGLDHVEQGRLKVREQDDWIWTRRLERYQPMVQGIYNGQDPKSLNARSLRMPGKTNSTWRPDSRILMGGSLVAPGDKVQPGVLSVLGIPVSLKKDGDPFVISNKLEGRRLALARWISHTENPLTARSIVNRVWQHHFGKPLAGNPNNFGAKGGKPTHPKLLDWLAADFVENGWKFKRLHRLIMLSKAYRQSGNHPEMEKLLTKDPDNHLLAYREPRRLTAEELRDGILKTTGELKVKMGGIPIMPEINMEVALQPRMIQFSIAPAYQPSRTPEERNRRTIYAYRVRGQADPFLELFNQPNPNDSCEERDAAAVTPQAFTLLNSEVMSDRAIAFALRVEKEFDTLHLQVKRAVQLAYGRVPDKVEWERLKQYVTKMQEYHAKHDPKPVTYPTKVRRSLVEEFTGKPFDYEEILPVFENYLPDKKPADVEPSTRALADLCLILLNANEYIYVY